MRRRSSQASCRRWRRLHWRRKEAPLHRLSPSITSIPLYLSLNLSALLQDLKGKENTKEIKWRTPTLKHRNPSLKSKTTPKIKNCFILDLCRGIYRLRRLLEDETGSPSKIDAWARLVFYNFNSPINTTAEAQNEAVLDFRSSFWF